MKQINIFSILAILIIGFSVSSCNKDEEMPTTPVVEELAYVDINCQSFFEVGDYSDVCDFNPLPFSFQASGSEADDNCVFSLKVNESDEQFAYIVIPSIYNSVDIADSNYDLYVNLDFPEQYPEGFITEYEEEIIPNLGDKAILVQYLEADQRRHMILTVKLENTVLSFENFYSINVAQPCFHDKAEVIKFANVFISNM